MAEEHIYFGFVEKDLVIIPVGHITATLCPELKTELLALLGPDSGVGSMRFDFSACLYMDSTFLGLIVYLAKTARSLGIGQPIVHRADAQCESLFRTMGMTRMLEFSDEPCPAPAEKKELVAQEALSAGFLLDAHKELSMLSAENEERFRALTSALSSDPSLDE
ncbi:MAG TPA: STAS domain-containing protein [Rectinemataceae bacterium]|nr:STAS domain-containing protein [Rectinemataceae bacterium]